MAKFELRENGSKTELILRLLIALEDSCESEILIIDEGFISRLEAIKEKTDGLLKKFVLFEKHDG